MPQLTSTEMRTLVAAQIASGLVGQVAPNTPQTTRSMRWRSSL